MLRRPHTSHPPAYTRAHFSIQTGTYAPRYSLACGLVFKSVYAPRWSATSFFKMRGPAWVGRLALATSTVAAAAGLLDFEPRENDFRSSLQRAASPRLAVVVPAYRGDISRAVSSLERWPSACSPVTQRNVDLVLYYAEGEEDSDVVTAAADTIATSAGSCFSTTRTIYAHLSEEVKHRCTQRSILNY